MKRIAFLFVCVFAALAFGYVKFPDEFNQGVEWTTKSGQWAWEGIKANPLPVGFAVGTFLLTVVYQKAKGKSLRESVEAAATRVTVVNVPAKDADADNRVVQRAKARATRAQLLADQIGLQNRQRKLPEEVLKAEKDACYSEQALADAERKLAEKQKNHDEAVTKLEALRKEKAMSMAELAEIEVELTKLAELV
ncbi:MAG TPA: hypothetical protein VHR66_09555 [Gemmataceae bacterium]|jgi:hypothetical protein|nr:hypothetical protein [Gemmataceae bacterium]